MKGWEAVYAPGTDVLIGYVLDLDGCQLQVSYDEKTGGWYFDATNHFSPEKAKRAAEERAVKAGL